MDIASLGLHITDLCNARCLHCAFGCGPEIEGSMGFKEAKQYVADAKALDTEIVCITGGEPMLYPNLVKKIISECSRMSFPEIWLFTNGFWAHDTSKAREIVKKLRSLGLTKIFTSVNFFHQSYVSIESVKNAIEASLESSLEVCIDARFIGEPDKENEFNSATRSHLESGKSSLKS
jgi:MoaA/NifB/PqqE/SkfB family radical SAM enzyme